MRAERLLIAVLPREGGGLRPKRNALGHEIPAFAGMTQYANGPPRRAERLRQLLAKTKLGDQRIVATDIAALEIVQQRTPLVDHHQQASA
jgi:hypothetical protein